jgi:hypothetical protein
MGSSKFHSRVLAVLVFALLSSNAVAAELPPLPAGLTAPAKPIQMPAFTLATPGGGKVGADEYKGKVLIARFWATW